MEREKEDHRTPLKPHRYPPWLVAVAVMIAGSLVYSMVLLPGHLTAFMALRRGEAAAAAGHRAIAEARLLDVLALFPSSQSARVEIAVLLLSDPSATQQQRGLDYVRGIKLNKYRRQRVSAVVPDRLRSAFERTQK